VNLSDFVLRFRLGEGEWQIFTLSKKETMIGRGEDNDMVLDHREVSRHHLRLSFTDNLFQITDLESSNGTRLDGISLVPQIPTSLRPGQMIETGDFTLVLAKSEEGGTHISKELLPYIIRYRFGDGTWQTFPMESGEKTFGRDPNCDFYLNDSEVSREHIRIRIDDDGIWIMDLGSTNGTIVNGVRLEPHQEHPLHSGQMFAIGNYLLQIDEPSRFYKAPSSVAGRAGETYISSENAQTIYEGDHVKPVTPVQAMNLMSQERVTIGRALDNVVVLDHPLVSRYHAVIERAGTGFRILDLGSTNGVFINDKRIEEEADLKDWDQIRVGAYSFVLFGEDLQQQVVSGLKLEAQNINQWVSKKTNLLQDISFTINPNEFVALVGMSGSEKNALLNALSGFKPASHGSVLINGIDLYEHYDLFRNDIGFVPQEVIVHAELTTETALGYVAKLRMPPDSTKDERNTVVTEVLEDLELSACREERIARLSNEQLKRVSIGCELLTKPRLFFLDETTSSLDPGSEYEMMRLLRRLADQGRTVVLITPATKNILLCDKVIFLARNGNLAFFGEPDDALMYFDQYRLDHERREKEMEFDDVYRILNDEARGTPEEWRERYLNSHAYQLAFGIEPRLAAAEPLPESLPAPKAEPVQRSAQKVSSLHQYFVLTARNLSVLAKDKISLTLMLGLAPLLGLLSLIWGRDLYDPVDGNVSAIIMLWFVGTLTSILVGAFSSVLEIVKETDIYQHERAANLRIMPYVFSKVGVGAVLALYQAGVLLFLSSYFVNPNLTSPTAFVAMYVTFFLGILTGYLIGLLISAIAPRSSIAWVLLMVVLVPLILYSGALLPMNLIPGGHHISVITPTRWVFESFVRITELGDELSTDPCWTGSDKTDRLQLLNALKEECPCMGESIFTDCADFPGILSPDFYDETTPLFLLAAEPKAPPTPVAYAYPTALPSSTPLPTPTLLPSLTPYPTPRSSNDFPRYLERMRSQNEEYQALVSDQFEQYRLDSIAQAEAYSEFLSAQGDEYANLVQNQSNEYSTAMQTYNNERASWQENRDKAISSAEALLEYFYDNFSQVFIGSVIGRWVILLLIQLILFLLIVLVQKRKDVV
jgi:ABC-type multidrug transport system ATPase subunit/pSer/pThr/pTyr-binding forkhead associated (FHA) protein